MSRDFDDVEGGEDASRWVDHLVYTADDLDAVVDTWEHVLGVRPAMCGQHPDWRISSAVLSIGPRCYVEIVAVDNSPDLSIERLPVPALFGLRTPRQRLSTFAVGVPSQFKDIDQYLVAARDAGYDLGCGQGGIRMLPGGSSLDGTFAYRSLDCMMGKGVVPFVVQWKDETMHPGSVAPQGCRLLGLEGVHPDPDELKSALEALRIPLRLEESERPGLVAIISSPNGVFRLSEGLQRVAEILPIDEKATP